MNVTAFIIGVTIGIIGIYFMTDKKMSATDWDDIICCAVVGMAGAGIFWWAWNGGRWW